MRVNSITFPNDKPFAVSDLTVLIGPNNSGKSQLLRDITNCGSSSVATPVVASAVAFEKISDISQLVAGTLIGERNHRGQQTDLVRGLGSNLSIGREQEFHLDNYKSIDRPLDIFHFPVGLLTMQFALLDAAARLQCINQTPTHNIQVDPPENLLQALLVDEACAEAKLNAIFKETFGVEIKLDASSLKDVCFRIGPNFNNLSKDPTTSYKALRKERLLDYEGEGMRSFAAIVVSVLVCRNRILLIDEPEAFLHPSHARKLGQWLAREASNSKCQIFVATHNANFLAGVISGATPPTVVRISRSQSSSHATQIPAQQVRDLAKNSLLSSQRVLESLFHRGVIVCEADGDRLVYQTVAEKNLDNVDYHFVFAHNKQSLKKVVSLLTKASIATAVIVDLDLINSETELVDLAQSFSNTESLDEIKEIRKRLATFFDEKSIKELFEEIKIEISSLSASLEAESLHSIEQVRSALKRIQRKSSNWSKLKELGIDAFDDALKEQCQKLILMLEEMGIFLVPVGELEGWFRLEINKQSWVPLALESIENNEQSEAITAFVKKVIERMERKTGKICYSSPADPTKVKLKSSNAEAKRFWGS